MPTTNPQEEKFNIITGAVGYRTRSDMTATPEKYLVAGSQNVLINEATDREGDKVESRAGYEMFGSESEDRDEILSEYTFKTKSGDTRLLRFTAAGVLEFYSDTAEDWEELKTSLNGSYPCRFTTVYVAAELLRELLFVNHSSSIWEWSGAMGTIASDASVTAGTITIQETIGTQGFLTAGTRSIRIKDSGGTWRETVYTNQSGSDFTVSTDLSAFTFDDNAPVVQVVREVTNQPASGFTNDVIKTLENHVYVGSHSSPVVYMSKSTAFNDYTFSTPRLATDGWQFVLDDFVIGFETNIAGESNESLVIFAGSDWIYRVELVDLGDSSTIAQIARVRPIVVSSGQGAVSQELIAKVKNSIIYINGFNELLELGSIENVSTVQQTPISDPIKPDFLAAVFTGGSIRFWRNNLLVFAPVSGKTFILAFREDERGTRRFWQPPQILPIARASDYNEKLIGHSGEITESYDMFVGTNDNGTNIAFKAYWAYNNFGDREKSKNFDKYFTELYMTSNTSINLTLLYEFLGAKAIKTYEFFGTTQAFLFTPNPSAALGVNNFGSNPLGSLLSSVPNFLKYRRFKKITPPDFFEMQVRFETDVIDAQFQILCHGCNFKISKNAQAKLID